MVKLTVKLRRQPNSAEKNKLQRVNSTPIDTQKVEQQTLRKTVKIIWKYFIFNISILIFYQKIEKF